MARAGDTLEDPASGDRLVFRRTAAETNGEVLEYEIWFVPRGFAVRDHVHPHQQERHEVVEGSLGIAVEGRERRLGPGDVELVPPGTRHRLFPIENEPVHAVFESRPALRTEILLETIFGLARDGKVTARGNPGLLQLAVIFRELHEVGYPTSPPLALQRALLTPLAAIGWLRGYRAQYPAYSGHG